MKQTPYYSPTMEFAVIKTGGKQYKVQPGDVIEVERLDGEAGAQIELGRVLMLAADVASVPRVRTSWGYVAVSRAATCA